MSTSTLRFWAGSKQVLDKHVEFLGMWVMPPTAPGVSAERRGCNQSDNVLAQCRTSRKSPRSWSNQEAQTQVELFVTVRNRTSMTVRRLKGRCSTSRNAGHGIVDETCCPHFSVSWWNNSPLDFLAAKRWSILTPNGIFTGEVDFAQSLKAQGLVTKMLLASREPSKTRTTQSAIHPSCNRANSSPCLQRAKDTQGCPRASPRGTWRPTARSLASLGQPELLFRLQFGGLGILSGQREVIQAVSQNIQNFQTSQDWYNRDSAWTPS